MRTAVLIRDGKFHGENTDFSGFGRALRAGLAGAKLDRVIQLGADCAGSAVAYALLASGVRHLSLIDLHAVRVAERVDALRALFPDRIIEAHTSDELPDELAKADGFQQCTPIGMHHHPGSPIDIDLLEERHWVSDVVYRPVETALVEAALAKGCRVLDGGQMAVGQAVDAFRLITGVEPDAERMRRHFLGLLAQGL